MVTFISTSCGRPDLLKRSMDSFMEYNTFPISEYIITEDSTDKSIYEELLYMYPDFNILFNDKNIGLIRCLDRLYSKVRTPYVFHCGDDWAFKKSGFIEESLKVLDSDTRNFQAWLQPIGGHEFVQQNYYKLILHNLSDPEHPWYGFGFVPGLRRLSDYKLIGSFADYLCAGDYPALTEWRINVKYHELDFRAVCLNDEYCYNIGANRVNPGGERK